MGEATVTHFTAYLRTLCFVLNGDDVLLMKGAPTKRFYANQYNGVGGHVERNEDVFSSLQREVAEETGLQLVNPVLRAVIVSAEVIAGDSNQSGVLVFVYTASSASREVRPSEEGELVWASRRSLMDYDLVPDLRELLPRLFAAPAGRLIYGHYGEAGIMFRE
jgi:8-oxo-dGTP diphosphatase